VDAVTTIRDINKKPNNQVGFFVFVFAPPLKLWRHAVARGKHV